MRLSIRVALVQHRLLRLFSKTYREHDTVVSDRERWRRECVVAGNEKSEALAKAREAGEVAAGLRERLKIAVEAQQKAAEQLISERALRQSADDRAERYHSELVEALKKNADWLAVGLRGPVFGARAPEKDRDDSPVDVPAKQSARRVAQQETHATLAAMMDRIRSGPDEVHVGPEFTTQ